MSITATLLSIEQALTQRILFGKSVPKEFWQWLADRKPQTVHVPLAWSQPELASALSEIIDPMLTDSKPFERSRYASDARMIAAIFRFMSSQVEPQRWTFVNRLMAAGLMPLYRCLATGDLAEALRQTRLALGDSLALVGLANELGSDVEQLLERESCSGTAPHECLLTTLNLQLSRISQIMVFAGVNWDHEDESQLIELVCRADSESKFNRAVLWANPGVIWRLAGELMSRKAEFVMPREWINVPVPWGNVAEHWSSIEHLLTVVSSRSLRARQAVGATEFERDLASGTRSIPLTDLVSESLAHCADSPDCGHGPSGNPSATQRKQASIMPARDSSSPSVLTIDNDHELEDEPMLANAPAVDVVPKIILGEVHSHNDPVFTNLVSRQLSTCRSEARSVCLMAMRVEPEEEQDRQQLSASCDNGLVLWQQKLVNWLADQPEVQEPYAFTSTAGELILCLLDIERNTATSLLRQGLVEVLTGKRLVHDAMVSLARVHVPARYHAGIASVSNPGASFAAQQLITATYRCLEAAKRHGKAAIKSIEVF